MCRPGASSTRAAGCPRIRFFTFCGSFVPTPSVRCAEAWPEEMDEDKEEMMMMMIGGMIPTDGVACSPVPCEDEDDCSPVHRLTRFSRSGSDSSSNHVREPGPAGDDNDDVRFTNATSKRSAPIDGKACSRHLEVHSKPEALISGDDSSRPRHVPLQDLKEITDNFSNARVLGRGGFGVVYKGLLQNGEMIAVKKIVSTLMPGLQKQFESEVYHLMMLKHTNIVRCLGYCYETHSKCLEYNGKYIFAEMAERLICLEYMPKGSLDMYLSGHICRNALLLATNADESSGLGWSTRYNIIEGICYGLCHLHEQMVIHLDLKPANILLDDSMLPKITDFGMSRLLDQQQTICTSSRDGTLGCMAPEYLHGGTITPKSDIFSLGVIILEMVTGHRDYPDIGTSPFDAFVKLTLGKWRNVLQRSHGYGSLEIGYQQIKRCIEVGLVCVNPDRNRRPPIMKVISMLQGLESINRDISNGEAT